MIRGELQLHDGTGSAFEQVWSLILNDSVTCLSDRWTQAMPLDA